MMNKFIMMASAMFCLMMGTAFASFSTISPKGHEAIKAKVLDATPENFTINVRYLTNMGADEEAPTFALYTASSLPESCGDFSNLSISYTKPEKYKRLFDLSKHKDVLEAINTYKCVVIKNIPSK